MTIYDSENTPLICYNAELKNIATVLVSTLLPTEILGYKSIFIENDIGYYLARLERKTLCYSPIPKNA